MRKYCFFLTSLSIFACGHLYPQQFYGGSSARHIALGGVPINPYFRDVMRAHINPAQLALDSNVVWGDLGYLATDIGNGGGRNQYLGVSTVVTEKICVGLILNKRESPLYNSDPSAPALDPIDEMNGYSSSILGFGASQFGRPMSPIELVGTFRSPSCDLGASVSYGAWQNTQSGTASIDEHERAIRLKLGVIAASVAPVLTFDASILVGLNSISGTNSVSGQINTLSMNGGTEFSLDLRVESVVNERWTLVPRLRWYSFGWSLNQVRNGSPANPNPSSEYSRDELEIGIGEDYSSGNVLIVGGLSYQRTVLENNYMTPGASSTNTITVNDLPKINLGAEIRLASWVVARIGYFDRLATTETATGSGKTTTAVSSELPWYGDPNGLSAAQQRITLGLGINVAGLLFDGTMGEGYFLNGPWPLSGTAQQMFGVVSVSFHF